DQGRGRVLGQHQPRVEPRVTGQERGQVVVEGRVEQPVDPPLGDVGQLGQGDGQEVEREGQGLAVEVADRDDLARLGEHHRVVGDRAELALDHLAGEGDHVPAGPAHLGGGAQRGGGPDRAGGGGGRGGGGWAGGGGRAPGWACAPAASWGGPAGPPARGGGAARAGGPGRAG